MGCAKCYEKIKEGEEIGIGNSQFLCISCAKRPIDLCYTCLNKIYRDQKFYSVSKKQNIKSSFSSLFSFSNEENSSEQLTQCINCYLVWKFEEMRWQFFLKLWIFNFFLWITIFVVHWIWHILSSHEIRFDQSGWFMKMIWNHPKWCNISHLFFCAYLVIFYVFIYLNYYPNRHKLRLRLKGNKNKSKNKK